MIRRFNRFELKYVIPSRLRDAMLPEIQAQMNPDPSGEEGVYDVTSLYYDTDDFACYRAKLDGIKFRRKLRIRRYGPADGDANPKVTFEIKQRINRTTQKRRVPMRLETAYALARGQSPELDDERDRAVVQEIDFLIRSRRQRATCLVSYQRQAFIGGQYEVGLRLTFDQAIWCNSKASLLDESGRRFMLPPDYVVMEVKANNAVALWVSRMLARHGVCLTRFSKYCTGVACLEKTGALHFSTPGDSHG